MASGFLTDVPQSTSDIERNTSMSASSENTVGTVQPHAGATSWAEIKESTKVRRAHT